jgi:hypothetical protein
MFTPGQKIKCVQGEGAYLKSGVVYTCKAFTRGWVYVKELPSPFDGGWRPSRFISPDEGKEYERFMDRVMKPVDLGQPVTA